MRRLLIFGLLLFLGTIVAAQQSSSFKITDHTFNAGGHPLDGVVLVSTSYRITLDAIGDSSADRDLASASYRMDAGFASAYPAPREVQQLEFIDSRTLAWDRGFDRAGDFYNLYQGLLGDLPSPEFGTCLQDDIVETWFDVDSQPTMRLRRQRMGRGAGPDLDNGEAYFYLVTADYRLEESTKGSASSGTERPNPTPCP